jgi:hypothetical protein
MKRHEKPMAGAIVHVREAGNNRWDSRRNEGPGEAEDAFAATNAANIRSTRSQYDQPRAIETVVGDFMCE